MGVLHIACQADPSYVPHSASMLHSVLTNAGMDEVHIHFLHGPALPDHVPGRLGGMVEALGGRIDFLRVDDALVRDLRFTEHLPPAHWYRLFLPELLPDVDRALYMDGDAIVIEPLAPLWETDLGDNYLGAVTNIFQADHFGRIPKLGLSSAESYFNSGVMLLDLAAWRRDDVTRTVLDWARANAEKLDWPEQDALNVVLGDRRLHLHPRWNCMNSILGFPWAAYVFGFDAIEEARRRPAIRHFEGPYSNKPWHYMCDFDLRELYLAHRRETPWPELKLEGRTPGNVWRRWRSRLGPRRVAGRVRRALSA